MTCASCVRRLERALEKNEGVDEAGVNFAAEKASVLYDPAVTNPDELIEAVRDAGYGADVRELRGKGGAGAREGAGRPRREREPRQREGHRSVPRGRGAITRSGESRRRSGLRCDPRRGVLGRGLPRARI